ncbi:MAG: hypothetical protein ACQER9_03295 [Nanobdellota archaeon]
MNKKNILGIISPLLLAFILIIISCFFGTFKVNIDFLESIDDQSSKIGTINIKNENILPRKYILERFVACKISENNPLGGRTMFLEINTDDKNFNLYRERSLDFRAGEEKTLDIYLKNNEIKAVTNKTYDELIIFNNSRHSCHNIPKNIYSKAYKIQIKN